MRHRSRSRNAGRLLLGPGGVAALFPHMAGVTPRFVLDVPAQRAAGYLWQDVGMTTPAVADGDTVARLRDPYTGTLHTPDVAFTLRFLNSVWVFGAAGGGGYGRLWAVPYTGTDKVLLAVRFADRAGPGAFCLPLSLSGGQRRVGFYTDDTAVLDDNGTLRGAGAGRTVGALTTMIGQFDAGGGGFFERDGATLFAGATTSAAVDTINLGGAFGGGGFGDADLYRAVVGDLA